MNLKKIRLEAVGHFGDDGTDVNESSYDRPVMLVYAGKFDSMDGPVEITDEHIDLLCLNHNSFLSKVKRLASGDIPMREYPPLQLDHSSSAAHTIGRLIGNLTVGQAEINGENKKALLGVARFLGKENVEKAKDGRYTHVSIGADLESGKINELSVTPFPAAPHASLLSTKVKRLGAYKGVNYEVEEVEPGVYNIYVNGKKVSDHAGSPEEVDKEAQRWIDHEQSEGDKGMHEKLKKHLMEARKLADKDAEELSKKMREHHMKHMGKSDDEMTKHLEAADDKELKRLADEYDAHCSKLAADADKEKKEKEEKLTAARDGFIRLAKDIGKGSGTVVKEIRLTAINSRVAKLRSAGKITPAEIKKLDTNKLADMTEKECEAALSTFDLREPVVQFGVSVGSSKAIAIEAVAKKYRMARLEIESRLNMPSKKAEAEAMLAKLTEEEKKEIAKAASGEGSGSGEPAKGMLHKLTYEHLEKMLEDAKQHGELKKHLKHLVEHYAATGEEPKEGDEKRMSALAKSYADLQNKFNELITVVSPALGIKQEDLK